MTFRRVSVVAHPHKARAAELRDQIGEHLVAAGLEIVEEDPDLVVSLGGDGTMLRAARVAHAADAPLLGVNLGTLGYLTDTDEDGAAEALKSVMAGDFEVEERMMLLCDLDDPGSSETYVGLNEVLVERTSRMRLVRLHVTIGGESLAAFNADGIIVATPTGSTAYALSAGGPIVSPRAECLIVVPVSPHMIFSRPFVLAPDETVEITLDGDHLQAHVSLDGQLGCAIDSGSRVTVRRHERPLRLLRVTGPGFLERLRSKLGLPA